MIQATDRLELARNEMTRTRTLMLFRIHRVLTDDQNVKIHAMFEHDRSERDRKDREHRPKGPL